MISKINTAVLSGLEGINVEVETDISRGMPNFFIVGLAGASVKESKERVKSAIKNSGFDFPISRIVANLSPANIRKEGAHLDLPIAAGILKSSEVIKGKTENTAFIGELSLSGEIMEIDGALPLAIEFEKMGIERLILPEGNKEEAGVLKNIEIYPVKSLLDTVKFLNGKLDIVPYKTEVKIEAEEKKGKTDFKNIRGQHAAKRAVELAASGMHNIIINGPAGSGKTMMASAVSGILPSLSFNEAVEITKIHSIKGENRKREFITERPFRSPHHTSTYAAVCGGGRNALPGEISLAHGGILFMDEFPEFDSKVIEALRQPLEDRKITVSRLDITAEYPSDFMLIATMNPCPCGNFGTEGECICTPRDLARYRKKLSAPILDRIDIQIDVKRVEFEEIIEKSEEESSEVIKKRIIRTHNIQRERFKDENIFFNSQMNSEQVKKYCSIDNESIEFLKLVFDSYGLSARAYNNILKLSRTIADMNEERNINAAHIAEAVQYRNRISGGNYNEGI